MKFSGCFPIFIVGSPRSGTSLLQLMIDAHPNITISGEVHFFDQILEIKKHVPSLKDPNDFEMFYSLLNKIHDLQFFPDADKVFPNVKREMASDPGRSYESFYKGVLEQVAKGKGARRYGEKTPTNIRYLDQLVEIFPNAKIIHIIRDPRGVVASKMKMPWSSNDIVTNTLKWKLDVECGLEFSKTSRSYYELRYVDLVSDPEIQLKKVCEFIGEAYDSKMLDYRKSSQRFAKDKPWMQGTYQKVYKTAVETWQTELSETQIYIIQRMVYPLLIRFGYEPFRIRFRAKLLAPIVFLNEMFKFLKYKGREFYERKYIDTETQYWGESRNLYKMFFRRLFKGKS
jgi:Sulfotransferase family